MFNLFAGHGLGFTASKEMAFGLGAMATTEIPVPPSPQQPWRFGGGGGLTTIYDNAYSRRGDEQEMQELLTILFQVIE